MAASQFRWCGFKDVDHYFPFRLKERTSNTNIDGVWACASLLHVARSRISVATDKLAEALKVGGLLYASFKYGNGEIMRNGRSFNSYDETAFMDLIKNHVNRKLIKTWRTEDAQKDQTNDIWLNVLLRKSAGRQNDDSSAVDCGTPYSTVNVTLLP